MTYHVSEAFCPSFKILLLPVLLKISHLDTGIQDQANKIDATVVERAVPFTEITEASIECRDNLHIL